MSAPDGTYQDGDFPWDGFTAGIGSKTYIFEDFSPTEGSNFVVSNNEAGVPRGGRDTRTVITASGTCQFPSGSTEADVPPLFTEVPVPYRGTTKTFVLTEVGTMKRSGQETKMSVKLREKINA